ncbi:MAG TPA: winged helix DNA-binding domain-containing protein [Candidatus Sulfopaludibacter sp.]|jgi:hypothetical protein|nr:winged helix DNA-binding domain-containing protein [Candidatus Sulfopaludibacter sp.]
MRKLSWKRAAAWRAHRHHLVERAPAGSLLTVASRLCGLHAQLLSSAELTAWARVEGLERTAVHQALWQDRTLVKTWAMRGTLHLLPSSELPLWHAGLATCRRYLREAQWIKYFGITLEELDRVSATIGEVLDNRVMTREELVSEVVRRTGSAAFSGNAAASSWGTVLKPAAFSGVLCFGPNAGTRVQFTRPDTWVKLGPKIDRDSATAEITRRFLAAYAPATVHDLARWWSGGVSEARQWIDSLGNEVSPVDVEGMQSWMLTGDLREACDLAPKGSVRLLPGFDQYVVGASWHAANLLPGDLRARVYRPQGWISPVLLVNGMIHGVWRHAVTGGRLEVTIEPFVPLFTRLRRAIAAEAERLAAFLNKPLELYFSLN